MAKVYEQDKLIGDITMLAGKLNYIRSMKPVKYTKWNLWHVAKGLYDNKETSLNYPELIELFDIKSIK